MPTVTFTSHLDHPAPALFAWHTRPGAFQRLIPPWAPVSLEHFEGIRDGQRAVIRLGRPPLVIRWIAEHRDYVEGSRFRDVQLMGPFRRWEHTHLMEPDGPDAAILTDRIDYDMPLGALGETVGGRAIRGQLDRQFAYRHRITRHDLDAHQHYNPTGRSLKIAVSGSSGLIGSNLAAFLTTGGHDVRRLVRTPPGAGSQDLYWDPDSDALNASALEGLDAVVHLAGERVFTLRWNASRKARIYESRVDGTRLLSRALARLERPPRVLLCASGVGYYGDRGDEALSEDAAPGTGFLANVCRAWEAATEPAEAAGLRVVHLRIGAVLTPAGGALRRLALPFRLGLGGYAGDGTPYLSWILLDDVLYALYHALWTDDLHGPVNVVSPEAVPMHTFARTLGRVLSRPTLLRLPAGLARTAFGETADEILLTGARARPNRLLDTGYRFRFPHLDAGLRHVFGKTKFGQTRDA